MAITGRGFPIKNHYNDKFFLLRPLMYSRGSAPFGSLPTTNALLVTPYSATELVTASTTDASTVDATSDSGDYAIHEFKRVMTSQSAFNITWTGQTTRAGSAATITLEIYNVNSGAWESLATNTTVAINTNFSLVGSVANNANYFDKNFTVSFRVYQRSSTI